MSIQLKPIGILHSPFKQKFGVPRQSGLVKHGRAWIEILPPYNTRAAFSDLEKFSHIWVVFWFHQTVSEEWRPMIRPPRLGGNIKTGVFATRSPHRPNPIGLSAVKLLGIKQEKGKLRVYIECPDMVDQTPIVDIKPYIGYADAIEDAQCSFAQTPPEQKFEIGFSEAANHSLQELGQASYPDLKDFIIESLQYDPRPAYKPDDDNKIYGMHCYDLNIKWHLQGNNRIEVLEISHDRSE